MREAADKGTESNHNQSSVIDNLQAFIMTERDKKVLSNEQSSPQAKLKAAEELLCKLGLTNIIIEDKNGPRNLKLEVEAGTEGRQMVHVYADDDNGKERIVLRGVDNGKGKGKISKETENGHEVSFVGSQWSRIENGKSFLGADNKESEAASAEKKPTQTDGADKKPAKTDGPEKKPTKTEPAEIPALRVPPSTDLPQQREPVNQFNDQVKIGRIDPQTKLPDSVSIGKENPQILKRIPINGHENDYLDTKTGAFYRLKLDTENGSMTVVQISDSTRADGGVRGETRTFLKGGNEIKNIKQEDLSSLKVMRPDGTAQTEAQYNNGDTTHISKLHVPSIKGPDLNLEAKDWTGWQLTDQNGKRYEAEISTNGTAVYKRLSSDGKAVEKTIVNPDGSMIVTACGSDGRPDMATSVKVEGHVYSVGSDGHWKDSESNEDVDVSINGNKVTVER